METITTVNISPTDKTVSTSSTEKKIIKGTTLFYAVDHKYYLFYRPGREKNASCALIARQN